MLDRSKLTHQNIKDALNTFLEVDGTRLFLPPESAAAEIMQNGLEKPFRIRASYGRTNADLRIHPGPFKLVSLFTKGRVIEYRLETYPYPVSEEFFPIRDAIYRAWEEKGFPTKR